MKYIIFTFFPEFIANFKKTVTEYSNNFFENARKFKNFKAVALLRVCPFPRCLEQRHFYNSDPNFFGRIRDGNSCLYVYTKAIYVHHIKQMTFGFLVFTSVLTGLQ